MDFSEDPAQLPVASKQVRDPTALFLRRQVGDHAAYPCRQLVFIFFFVLRYHRHIAALLQKVGRKVDKNALGASFFQGADIKCNTAHGSPPKDFLPQSIVHPAHVCESAAVCIPLQSADSLSLGSKRSGRVRLQKTQPKRRRFETVCRSLQRNADRSLLRSIAPGWTGLCGRKVCSRA